MATIKLLTDVHGNPLPCEFVQLDERLVEELRYLPEFINNNWDVWGLVFGIPGSGKSHWMQRVGLFLNASFSLHDIVFTPRQFDEWVNDAEPGSVCVFDEADVASNDWRDKRLRSLIRNSKRMREKRLYVMMGTPTGKDMAHFFISRSRFVTYVFAKSVTDRGWYHYYSGAHKPALLYAALKKAYAETPDVYHSSLSTIKNGYIGRSIPPDWPIDDDAYRDKKEAARRELEEDEVSPRDAVVAFRRDCLPRFFRWYHQKHGKDALQKDAAFVFGVDPSTISLDLRDMGGWS